ncbi:MAG: nucleotidyltransferase domain-containing protein [Deltaproteobacteria bacterium]|nr:MAG: nucleotidyltransferase domain-containing protein [Deltaproteobacteria bacterium]
MNRLSPTTQTLYAELLEQLLSIETKRSLGHLKGSFVSKKLKGEDYIYFQYSEPGNKTRQIYFGKKDKTTNDLIKKFETNKTLLLKDQEHLQKLCAQLRAGGALMTDHASGRIIQAFVDSGFFHMGGVLVGTHAFIVLGNLLGIHWESALLKTQDIDVAGESNMNIVFPGHKKTPYEEVPDLLKRLEMGFIPVPTLNPKHPSTSFRVRGNPLRVDVLTPLIGKNSNKPIILKALNIAAQPLRFLDYLIEAPEKAALIYSHGLLINVPSPARMAFHKLLIAAERPVAMQDKVDKDIHQAAQLFLFLAEERPGDLLLAWEDLLNRGKGWKSRVCLGFKKMKKYKEASQRLSELITDFKK